MAHPEVVPNLSSVPMPPRKGRLETYLWDKGDEESVKLAEQMYDSERAISSTCVLIPIAAHQEAEQILPAMREYADQEGATPFSICLLLNSPSGADEEAAREADLQAQAAQEAFPGLDIRIGRITYRSEMSIGQIRKDLWDAVARVALADGTYGQPGAEIIAINHDIDTVSIGRHYIRNVQQHYQIEQVELEESGMSERPLLPRYTQVKHAYPFATHPNIARVVLWTDLTSRQEWRNGSYEEGLVIPLSYYAAKGGFHPEYVTHETRNFAPPDDKGIPGTGMETSPRRYIDRLGKVGIANIWTADSFTSTDACRDSTQLFPDITHRELEDIILATLDEALVSFGSGIPQAYWEPIINAAVMDPAADGSDIEAYLKTLNLQPVIVKYLVPRLKLAKHALERVIGLTEVAELVDDSIFTLHATHYEWALKEAIKEDLQLLR